MVALPVVIADDPECGVPLRDALIGGGLPVAEVTLRTAAAPDVIRVLAERGDILVGAGTETVARLIGWAGLVLATRPWRRLPAGDAGRA